MRDTEAARSDRFARWSAVLLAVLAALAVVLLREVEVEAEYDRYHQIAEHLLQGHMVFDRFHPFGYPLLVAAVLSLVGNSLMAGGLVSAFAGGLVVWSSSRIAERLRPGAGVGAALLVAGNGAVWIYASMACSDMTATAATFLALAGVVCGPPVPSMRRALAVGALLGFATSVRFSSAVVAVTLGLWVLRVGGLRAAAAALVGGALGYLPQAIPATLLTGSPLTNENWHNVYLKVVCGFDYECLQHAYDSGTLPTAGGFLREHGGEIVRLGLRDTWLACSETLPAMVFGSLEPVAALWLWPLLLAALGLMAGDAVRRSGGWLLLLLAGMQVATTCLVFEPRPRVLLAVVPLASIGLAVLGQSLPRPWARRAVLVGLLVVSTGFGARSYGRFLAAQPVAEVALVRRLPDLVQRPMGLLTSLPVADRYVAARVLGYMAAGYATPEATWQGVRQRMEAAGVDVFVTGRVSNAHVFEHLANSAVPPDFTLLHADADAIALERMPAVSPWIASFTATPSGPRIGEQVLFALRLSDDAVLAEVAGAGVAVRDANGDQALFDLPAVAAGAFERAFVVPPIPGTWRLTPFVLRGNGQVLRGAETSMHVRP